ncbi:MAG: hypothetical protein ACE5KM_13615 [Planctomycetaceae bacterium]
MNRIDTRIRPEVQHVLGRLKSGIRWYVLIEGVTLIIVLAALLFWISFSVDGLWFAASKYELARWFRYGFDAFAGAIILLGGLYWIGMRLFRSIRSKPLALVLERRFPDLNDKLVTSVELRETVTGRETDLTVEMLNRTVENAADEARQLKVSDVFETRPMRWACIGALVAVISVLGYGVAYPEDMQRWADAYIYGEDEYWERDTRLTVHVIDSITNRVREFDDKREYKHPRGGDLTLLVRVPRRDDTGKELVVPDEVYVQYRMGDEGTKSAKCSRTSKRSREFRCSFGGLREDMVFWVTGNDFKNKKPYIVKLVDPPRVDSIVLDCAYPAYTDLNDDDAVDKQKTVKGRQVDVPMETLFLMQVQTNKPVIRARLEFGRFELDFGWMPRADDAGLRAKDPRAVRDFEARLIAKGLTPPQTTLVQSVAGVAVAKSLAKRKFTFSIPKAIARNFFVDGKTPGFRLPFIVSTQKTAAALARFRPDKRLGETFQGFAPFLMPPDSEVRIYLEDDDEIGSPDPELLVIHGNPDPAPAIEAQRVDIGNSVTRFASIPIVARISDERHGVKLVRLEYRVAPKSRNTTEGQPWKYWSVDGVDDDTPQKRRDKTGRWPRLFKFHSLRKDEEVNYELFENSQIKITDVDAAGQEQLRDLLPGDKLTIAVYAEDADDINGPNFRRSAQVFDFRIVTLKELDVILFEKESRLRIDFEKIIGEVEKTRAELVDRKIQLREWTALSAVKPAPGKEAEHAEQLADAMNAIRRTASRSRAKLRKNHNETQGVLQGFRQLRAEIVNNKMPVDTTRLKQDIIDVIAEAVKEVPGNAPVKPRGNYDNVDRALGAYSRAVDTKDAKGNDREIVPADVAVALDDSIQQTDDLLARLKDALKEMKELVKFHQAVGLLLEIIDLEKNLKIATELLRNAKILGGSGSPKP